MKCLIAILFVLVLPALAQGTEGETVNLAYIANGGTNNIQVIDLDTGRTLRKIYAGANPWRLVREPGSTRLLAQHWYSQTTAVIQMTTGAVEKNLPVRGPGLFDHDNRFISFSWPGSGLFRFSPGNLDTDGQRVTGVDKVYNFTTIPNSKQLYMARFDPDANGEQEHYAYMVAYPNADEADGQPLSQRTGHDPRHVVSVKNGRFLITADSGSNGLSLVNTKGDGRAVPAAPAPRAILISADETRMVVLCWQEKRVGLSTVISYRTDFSTRPWPTITLEKKVQIKGGLVAGRLSEDHKRLYALDTIGNRLLELDSQTLEQKRSWATGASPRDLEVVALPKSSVAKLVQEEKRVRGQMTAVLEGMRKTSMAFSDLSWRETIYDEKEETSKRHNQMSYMAPDRLRSERERGTYRLAADGWSLSLHPDGRFNTGPRQELLSLVYGVANGKVGDVLKRLAGDVPGSPLMRNGLAMDLMHERKVKDKRYLVLGSDDPALPISQLWVDAETFLPMRLLEHFPTFKARGHDESGFSGLVETLFLEHTHFGEGVSLPTKMKRIVDSKHTQIIKLNEVKLNSGLDKTLFDPQRLGGLTATLADLGKKADLKGEPGRQVAVMPQGYLKRRGAGHEAYNSNPPTSGPRLQELAQWGEHSLPVAPEIAVHNLEHGAVILHYRNEQVGSELIAKLRAVTLENPNLILAPNPLMKAPVALTAWGRIRTLDGFDKTVIEAFIKAYAGKDHHKPTVRSNTHSP